MIYIYLDGDDIGRKIASCFLENNDRKLAQVIQDLDTILSQIRDYLKNMGLEIVFFAADGIACKGTNLEIESFAFYIKSIGQSGYTFSAGIGNSLQNSFFALEYAKAIGKNRTVLCDDGKIFKVVEIDS